VDVLQLKLEDREEVETEEGDKMNIFELKCYYCGNINKIKYLGNEEPKKVKFQCRECKRDIKYEDEVARNFRFY